jgi:hypothetical protein
MTTEVRFCHGSCSDAEQEKYLEVFIAQNRLTAKTQRTQRKTPYYFLKSLA